MYGLTQHLEGMLGSSNSEDNAENPNNDLPPFMRDGQLGDLQGLKEYLNVLEQTSAKVAQRTVPAEQLPWWMDTKKSWPLITVEDTEEFPVTDRTTSQLWKKLAALLFLYSHYFRAQKTCSDSHFVCVVSLVLDHNPENIQSVAHALRLVMASLALESETFIAESSKIQCLCDIEALLQTPDHVLTAISDLANNYRQSTDDDENSTNSDMCSYVKKLGFLAKSHREYFETMIVTLSSLVANYRLERRDFTLDIEQKDVTALKN